MEVNSDSCRFTFDPEVKNLVSIVNTSSGDDYIKLRPTVPIIHLWGFKGNQWTRFLPDTPTVVKEHDTLTITFPSFEGNAITSVLQLCIQENNRLIIGGYVQNNTADCKICEFVAPHISGIALGRDHRDDTITYPHHAGEKTRNPVEEYASQRYRDFWRAGSMQSEGVFRREINYCGLASMTWMYYYDKQNGLYLGSHDLRLPVTGIIAETGWPDQACMGFAFRKHHRLPCGEQYELGKYVLAVSDKDWHYGAKIYNEYIAPQLDFDHTPAFWNDQYALNQCYEFKRTDEVEQCIRRVEITNRFCDIPALFESGKRRGVNHFFMAAWNRTGFDSCYPEYYPDMELGSAMEFRRGLRYIRDHGGFSTLYINARIFDVESDFHATMGKNMAIRRPDGSMISETYGPAHFTVNCPSDKLWRDYLLDTAEFTVIAYGADGIYLDQLASAEPFACYNEEHSHKDIGEFNNGYLYVLKNLLKRLKEHKPAAYILVENCGDVYSSYTSGNLTWNGAPYDEYFNVFKYTFPQYIQINMVDPRHWISDKKQKLEWFYKDMERAILIGSILWMGHILRLTEDNPYVGYVPEIIDYAKKALAFRASMQPFLLSAIFEDDNYIAGKTPGCAATCWRLEEDGVMLLCGNHAQVPDAWVKFTLPFTVSSVKSYDENGSPAYVVVLQNRIEVNMQNSRLICIFAQKG